MKTRQTKEELRSLTNLTTVLRSIQLLINRWNEFINFCAMVGHKTLAVLLATTCLYLLVKLYDILTLPALLTYACAVFGICLISNVIYPYMADIGMEANTFRSSWAMHRAQAQHCVTKTTQIDTTLSNETSRLVQNVSEDKELKRLLRSCPNFYIKVGTYYSYTRTTPSTFNRIVLDNTINLLLTF